MLFKFFVVHFFLMNNSTSFLILGCENQLGRDYWYQDDDEGVQMVQVDPYVFIFPYFFVIRNICNSLLKKFKKEKKEEEEEEEENSRC